MPGYVLGTFSFMRKEVNIKMSTQPMGAIDRLIKMSDQALDILEQAMQGKDSQVKIRAAETTLQTFLQFMHGSK